MNAKFTKILVVDDDPMTRIVIEQILGKNGYTPDSADNGLHAVEMLERGDTHPDMIFLDVMMPEMDGFEAFRAIRKIKGFEKTPIIFITSTSDQATIEKCFQIGAADYISKPVRDNELLARIKIHVDLKRQKHELRELEREHTELKNRLLTRNLQQPEAFSAILTVSTKMQAIFQYIESISKTTRPVFVTGETGTGKELIAKATHALSGRKGSFVPLNVAGLDDNLFSDTLFGHVKGAFTGAVSDRSGLIEEAAGGTLFLDEIGDLDMLSQVKLLRLLQEAEYYPLGSDQRKRSDARIVVATHQNIQKMVESGKFRKDLYYRLRTHHVHIPPLQERKCDLSILLDHFIAQASESLQREILPMPQELLPLLESYHFPGNIRELEGMVFDAVSRTTNEVLSLEAFRSAIARSMEDAQVMEGGDHGGDARSGEISILSLHSPSDIMDQFLDVRFPTLKELNGLLIEKALGRSNGNQALAAQMLGLSRQALNKRLKRQAEENSQVQ